MIYKLNLKEDVYSKEHLFEFVRTLKSSLSHYVENISDITNTERGASFNVIYDTNINKEVHIEITDEYDKYGFAPLEFNVYIDGEEFGPMCYSSMEIATMDTKDFILNKLDRIISSINEVTFKESMSTSLNAFLKSKVITVDSVTGIDPNCMKRSLMPRGCYFMSSALLGGRVVDHGTIHWQGTDYVFRIKPDGTVVTMTDAQAGSNWSETIFKEATLADYTIGDPDNQRYIGNAQVIKVSDLPKIGEKFKAGIATAINKIGYEDGYMIYEVWVTEPGSLEGFAEFEYDTARWLFAIKNFNEALERDNNQEKDLNEFTYKIDDLKQFYNTATGIDRNKYPNFFAWFDDMKKSGKLNSMQFSN